MTVSFDQRTIARRWTVGLADAACSLTDRFLPLLMIAAAFLLGVQVLSEADFWWHLRSGQWILEHKRVPILDPFTFGSAGRAWVDLHWGFQVILALAFGAGGVAGTILMTATLCAATLMVVLTLRDRRWPSPLVAVCWLPALLIMSSRFVPRPEILSLLWLALYLTILLRADTMPALAWILPLIQALWVNTHGLFVLGPIVLAAYLTDGLARTKGWVGEAPEGDRPGWKRWWLHLGGATVMVAVACLANPYGLRGVLFPLGLFPKITHWGGIYKSYILEFGDLRELVRRQGLSAFSGPYLKTECFLLWALPPSFVAPAVWRLSHAGARHPVVHLGAFVTAMTLLAASALGLPAPGTPELLILLGWLAAPAIAVLGGLGAAFLVRASGRAAALALLGGLATAAWMIWVRLHLIGPTPTMVAPILATNIGERVSGSIAALLMLATAGLVLRAGGRLFLMIIAVTFTYLALQAMRNVNLFGLVSGIVLTANLGGWVSDTAQRYGDQSHRAPKLALFALAARGFIAALIGLLIFSVVTDRFFRAVGDPPRFGFGEAPLAYAHDAARFAGRAGMPGRAVAYDLKEAGVYIYHNFPQRKVFVDGRLRVPDERTFATYVWIEDKLNEGGRGWSEPLKRLGDPLILLRHDKELGGAATLLADPGWRCVYFDAVASIFISRGGSDLDAAFPSVDFAARHFRDQEWRAEVPEPARLAEGKALLMLGTALQYRDGVSAALPVSIALAAGHRFRQAVAADRSSAGNWTLLGTACWILSGDVRATPPGPDEPWEIARGIFLAQATYCYQHALALDPLDQNARKGLISSLQVRGMRDGDRVFSNAVDWPTCDRVATTLLHLGRPDEARRIWDRAGAPPSPALKASRLATAALAEQDFAAAKDGYELALNLDPSLGEAWFGLALLHAQLGEAAEMLAACEEGLRQKPTPPQRASLERFRSLILKSE